MPDKKDGMIECWCGNRNLVPFSPLYLCCRDCGTLVLNYVTEKDVTHVTDDEADLYGKNYYLKRLVEQYGFPPIEERARTELSERCLHWLRTLLKYKLPPAKVLELGSSHGGFVAMMRRAGFDATGLELSPWLVEFARSTFDVPMLTGPVEDQDIPDGSLDAVVLMDVMEHLPDPLSTVGRCIKMLKPDGIALIQTPCYPESFNYEEMLAQQSPFLEQLKYEEHLYLFSQRSARNLLERLGAGNVSFEPAVFSHYDMFLVAGKSSLAFNVPESISNALSLGPDARMIQAMIDLDDVRKSLIEALDGCEEDRAARLEVIERQKKEFAENMKICEEDRAARLEVIERQKKEFAESMKICEEDRASRLEVIERQKKEFAESMKICEEDRAARLEVIERQKKEFAESMKMCEEDRAARLEVIRKQGETIAVLEGKLRDQDDKLKSREQELLRLGIAEGELTKTLDHIKDSASWKMTAPFRKIARLADYFAGRTRKDKR